MLQATLPPIRSRTRALPPARRPDGIWRRLCIALAILLLAVVPHATLAASAGHAMASPVTGSSHPDPARHDEASATSPAPCHEPGDAAQPEPHTMPSCCIIGCGLLSFSSEFTLAAVQTSWRAMESEPAHTGEDRAPEPAERPPRRLLQPA